MLFDFDSIHIAEQLHSTEGVQYGSNMVYFTLFHAGFLESYIKTRSAALNVLDKLYCYLS